MITEFEPVKLTKPNPINTFVHYKASYATQDIDNYWAFDWVQINWGRFPPIINPNIIRPNGSRDIASEFYPLIEPYSSNDPDVVDYQLLLMKYAGFDGLILEWYGYANIRPPSLPEIARPIPITKTKTAEVIAERANNIGLSHIFNYQVGTIRKNQNTISDIDAMIADTRYLVNYLVNMSNYYTINNRPLLLLQNPLSQLEFSRTAHILNPRAVYLHNWRWVLDAPSQYVNGFYTNAHRDSGSHGLLSTLALWYERQTPNYEHVFGSAHIGQKFFDGFNKSNVHVELTHNREVLRASLQLAKSYNLTYLQVYSWNNYNSGEIIEPTLEFGYEYLELVQKYAETTYDKTALEQVHRYYLLTKALRNLEQPNQPISKRVKQVYYYLISLQLDAAIELMDQIDTLFEELVI